MKSDLIAPCGMNCAVCVAYFGYNMNGSKRKIACPGCRPRNKGCAFLKKHCGLLANNEIDFCYECKAYPCQRLLKLDERYRKRYNMSMVKNLNSIRDHGMKEFLNMQSEKYRCSKCGGTICVHTNRCYSCSSF